MTATSLPGNPYADEDSVYTDSGHALVSATLALAFEQRTANLLAAAAYARSHDININMDLAKDIDARLGLGLGHRPPAAQPSAPARTIHDEAQELHRIIGVMVHAIENGGQYDTLGNYEDELTRALELAAIYVADTDPNE